MTDDSSSTHFITFTPEMGRGCDAHWSKSNEMGRGRVVGRSSRRVVCIFARQVFDLEPISFAFFEGAFSVFSEFFSMILLTIGPVDSPNLRVQ